MFVLCDLSWEIIYSCLITSVLRIGLGSIITPDQVKLVVEFEIHQDGSI